MVPQMVCQPVHQNTITPDNITSFIRYCEQGSRYDSLIAILPHGLNHPVYIRRATTDVYNFLQVFEEKEYQNLKSVPDTVVDLGAYVGYVSVYFAAILKSPRIIAIEPDQQNFMMLLLNTSPYKSVTCINAGIWNKPCKLSVSDKIGGDWGTMVTDNSNGSINGITMMDIIKDHNLTDIDFLKIDIEGSEKELFRSGTYEEWIKRVNIVHCETHDRFIDGCSSAYNAAFSGGEYSCEIINQAYRYSKT